MKKDKTPGFVLGLFGVIGLVFVIAGIFWIVSVNNFKKIAVETVAEITTIDTYRDSDGDRHHTVYVDYSYDGTSYDHVSLGFYSSNMYEGKEIELLLDPNNPRKISAKDEGYFGGIIFIIMGTVFGGVGLISLISSIKRNSKKKKLLEQGYYVVAIVESIDVNTSYTVNGRHPYLIYCVYQDPYSGMLYRFKSENLWTNPESVIQPGYGITVYVMPNDFSTYYVDVESIFQGNIVDYT